MMADESKPASPRKTSHDETYVVTVPTTSFDPLKPALIEEAEAGLSAQIEERHGKSAELADKSMTYEHTVGQHVMFLFTCKVKA